MNTPLSLTTPALLFPAISLLLLAYTNRFLGLASIIRHLFNDYQNNPEDKIIQQIGNLRSRINLIKWMQFLGVGSLFLCVVTMLQIYVQMAISAQYTFGVSLLLMMASLALSLLELRKSSDALNILLSDLEQQHGRG
jgi:ABC-type multidrug transport system fused ATPase/permease subunit